MKIGAKIGLRELELKRTFQLIKLLGQQYSESPAHCVRQETMLWFLIHSLEKMIMKNEKQKNMTLRGQDPNEKFLESRGQCHRD